MNAACKQCGHHNYTSARFCGQCGRSLLRVCHACQIQVSISDVHCHQCGHKLAESESTFQQPGYSDTDDLIDHHLERRQVTVHFCDLCGSTALSERLDPEELARVLRLYQDACAPILRAQGGYISRYSGDGIVTLFGFPRAYDDNAYRAVVAGLEIIEHFRHAPIIIDSEKQQLSVRVGIATGMVLAGDLIGADHAIEQPVVGQTPHLAARLQSVADTNTVLISELTHRLVHRTINCQKLGPLSLKGINNPLYAYRAIELSSTAVRINSAQSSPYTVSEFVNRVQEMAHLLKAWQKSKNAQGQSVLIKGEPGIGKSRLWKEFIKRLATDEHVLIPLRCLSNATNTPLHPLIELLADQSALLADNTRLKHSLSTEALASVSSTVTALMSTLKLESVDSAVPQSTHKNPIDLFVRLLGLISDNIPVILCLEDIHWADPTTMILIARISHIIDKKRILIVLLARSHVQLEQWSPHVLIELNRLNHNDACQIVNNKVGIDTLPGPLLDLILSKSDGIPLFVEEITHSLHEHHSTHSKDSDGTVLENSAFTVPDTLRDLLMARLDSLNDAKRTAQLASVIGREFTLQSVAELSGVPVSRLLIRMHTLLASGLIQVQESFDRHSYQFKHALIQNAAYESLTHTQKKTLHAKMAQLLEKTVDHDSLHVPEQIANHYHAAGQLYEAAVWWNQASGNALRSSANREAMHHARQGVNLLKQIDRSCERDHLSMSLHIYLSSAIASTQGDAAPELEGIHSTAASLLERVNDDRLAFALTREMHAYFLIRGPVERACELGRKLLTLAKSTHHPQNMLDSQRSLGWTYFCHGQLQEGRNLLKLSTSAYRKADSRLHTQHDTIDPGAVGLINLAWVETLMGNTTLARELVEQAIHLATEIKHPYSLTYSLCMGGAVYQCLKQPIQTLDFVDQALTIAMKNEFKYFIAWGNALRGWVLSMCGQSSAGLELLLQGQNQYESTGAKLFMPHILSMRAEALLHSHQIKKAKNLLERAISIADDNGIHFYSGEILRLLAITHNQLGNSKESERLFIKATELVTQQGAAELAKRISTEYS